jgi:hypothetical protein
VDLASDEEMAYTASTAAAVYAPLFGALLVSYQGPAGKGAVAAGKEAGQQPSERGRVV